MKSILVCVFVSLTMSLASVAVQTPDELTTPKTKGLVRSTEADEALRLQLLTILEGRRQHQRGVRSSEIDALSAFVRSHPTTYAALRAKFLIGNAYLNEGLSSEVERGKPYFEEIIGYHPETLEAALARVQLRLLVLRDQTERQLREQQIADVRKAINDALPYTRELDKDTSDLSALFKRRTLGRDEDKFTPRLRLDLSALLQMEGNTDEARAELQAIIEEYPASLWSDKATRRLESMRREGHEAAARTEGP